MDVSRRGFLGGIAAATAGLALDPELALWKPGQRSYFLPSVAPATFGSMHDFTSEALRELKRALGAGILTRRRYEHVGRALALSKATQIGVDTWGTQIVGDRVDVTRDQLLRPLIVPMAQKIMEDRPRKFGDLSADIPAVDAAVVSDVASGLSIRGVRFYDVDRDGYAVRLECAYA